VDLGIAARALEEGEDGLDRTVLCIVSVLTAETMAIGKLYIVSLLLLSK
jgi:hypothetical protein